MKKNKPRPGPAKRERMTAMSHLIVALYLDNCDALPDHTADICDTGEHGRIGSVAFIKTAYTFTNPSDATEWQDAVAAGNVVIIPEVSGSYDGGKPKDGPGYGRAESTYMGSDHSLKFSDPTYKANIAFYNLLRKSRNYKMAFVTETQVHMIEAPCNFRPIAPVKDGLDTTVVWEVEVKWVFPDSPLAYDTPVGTFATGL
jgi:hypothetical protein